MTALSAIQRGTAEKRWQSSEGKEILRLWKTGVTAEERSGTIGRGARDYWTSDRGESITIFLGATLIM